MATARTPYRSSKENNQQVVGTYYFPNQSEKDPEQLCVIIYAGRVFKSRSIFMAHLCANGFTESTSAAVINRITKIKLSKDDTLEAIRATGVTAKEALKYFEDPRETKLKKMVKKEVSIKTPVEIIQESSELILSNSANSLKKAVR